MQFEAIINLLQQKFGEKIIEGIDHNASPRAIIVSPEKVAEICLELHENEQTYFDSLSCLTGIDNGPETGTMEVAYNLYSIPYDLHLMIKVVVSRDKPEVPTIVHIWKTADWHERETFDLMGIQFIGHPDLRRILLPADWEGHPLQKDYHNLEKYHGIEVAY